MARPVGRSRSTSPGRGCARIAEAKSLFQQANLIADSSLSHSEFGRGSSEVLGSRGSLERADRGKGRKSPHQQQP